MSEKGVKSQAGTLERRTVLQLRPVRYQVKLLYLGAERIERDARRYRCDAPLCALDSLDPLDPSTVLPNVVEGSREGEEYDRPARPRDEGGTPDDPPEASDRRLRILITDNHGTRTAENLTLLGERGDRKSNPTYYRERRWLPDVEPAVPFRVVVRRFAGTTPLPLEDDDLKVEIEIKDPREELDRNDGRRRAFLNDFFKKYNREDRDPTPGDDNALTWFKGGRRPSARDAGVKAEEVLKRLPYRDPPVVEEVCVERDVVAFSDLSGVTAAGDMNASLDLELVEDPDAGVEVGVADFALRPPPVSGDNYRFLLRVVKGTDDIRETRENGAEVELLDQDAHAIPAPRWYCGPRLTLWRKTEFRLCVLANHTTRNDIRWADITSWYRKVFLEVVPPSDYPELTREAWARIVQRMFSSTPDVGNAAHYTEEVYNRTLFPDVVTREVRVRGTVQRRVDFDKVEDFARRAIAEACQAAGIADPSSGDARRKQDDGNGLFMFLCKDPRVGSVLGAYIGDRIFWMRKPSGANGTAMATSTCAHEFGHVKSLRHAHTGGDWGFFAAAGAATADARYIIDPRSNNNPLDHDARDAFACLLSYTRPVTAEPCGLCALGMRFFDRVEIQKSTRFRNEIIERMGPLTAVTYSQNRSGQVILREIGGPIALDSSTNQTAFIMALGPDIAYTTRGGSNRTGRVNMTGIPKGEARWTRSNSHVGLAYVGSGTTFLRIRVTARSPGTSVVTYRNGRDPSISVTFNVS